MPPISLLLSAGEASGDMYAARLATALRARADVEIFGMGGPQMRAAGVEVVTDYSEVSVVGITEILSHLPSLVRAMRRLVREAERRRPALAILTDFPGFHLRLARKLKARGIRNAYYICPQFWAWRPWRVRVMRRRFAQALCIFPFEEKFYGDAGVPVKFIGHPLVGEVRATQDRVALCAEVRLDPAEPLVAVLPGSRSAELRQHLPVLREACRYIHAAVPRAQFVVAAAPGGSHGASSERAALREGWDPQVSLRVVEGRTYDALAAADAAIVSSGTATVEAALLDAPMVVVYRVTRLTAALAKPLVRTKFFSMVNLIAEKHVVPELIQSDFTPDKVAGETIRLLQDANARRALRAGLAEVRERLGPLGAVDRAADAILELVGIRER
ncbi:MAG TPA: lipid-A-disaccharide synthase [Candidatus Eisenbacteria bacterium]|jgi:lipid-A-disaccharide synthase|nr:lipid-A-disaccharide synthase [Candidatus Eisenbacteria bacterium]